MTAEARRGIGQTTGTVRQQASARGTQVGWRSSTRALVSDGEDSTIDWHFCVGYDFYNCKVNWDGDVYRGLNGQLGMVESPIEI